MLLKSGGEISPTALGPNAFVCVGGICRKTEAPKVSQTHYFRAMHNHLLEFSLVRVVTSRKNKKWALCEFYVWLQEKTELLQSRIDMFLV